MDTNPPYQHSQAERSSSSQIQSNQPFQSCQNYEDQTEAEKISMATQEGIYVQDEEEQRNYGKMIPLMKDQFNQPKFILGPHYFVFIPTLLICIWFLEYCLQIFYTKLHFDIIPMIVCFLAALFFIISYIRVGFSDPGIASKNTIPSLGARIQRAYCQPCKVLRTNQIRHCYYCDVCILEMDHHCVWVGKCIGKNNWNLFKVFLLSVALNLLVFAFCIILVAKPSRMQVK